MSLEYKFSERENLKDIQTFVVDTTQRSTKYFRVSDVPQVLQKGKNLLRITAHPTNLVDGTQIYVDVRDSNGEPIYFEIPDYLENDKSRVISIWVYNDKGIDNTPNGEATITLLGIANVDLNGNPLPPNQRGKINVKWQTTLNVDRDRNNSSEIIFNTDNVPNVIVSQSVELYENQSQTDNTLTETIQTGKARYIFSGTSPIIQITDSSTLNSEMIDGDIILSEFTEPAVPITNIDGAQSSTFFSSSIGSILNDTTLKPLTNFTTSFDNREDLTHTYESISEANYKIQYVQSGSNVTTQNKRNFVNLAFSNIDPITGVVDKIKILAKSQGLSGDFEFLNEVQIPYSSSVDIKVPIPSKNLNDPKILKLLYLNAEGSISRTETISEPFVFDGEQVYIGGEDNLISGSIFISNTLGTGIEIGGASSGFMRSVGYRGITSASLGKAPGGFVIYSGSGNLVFGEDQLLGVGMQFVGDNDDRHLVFSTANGGILDVKTDKFFIGNLTEQYISGSDGNIEISSSIFHLDPKANGGDGSLIIGANATILSDLTVENIRTPAQIDGAASTEANASSSIKADGFARFVSASIGGWGITTSSIEGGNLIMKPEGILQTKDFASGLKGWKISSEGNGTAEFENVRIRGTLRTTTFEKESVNAVGGQLWVANATTITGSVTSGETTMSVKNASGFSVGEILLAKKVDNTGFQTEYILLESASVDGDNSNEDETHGRIYVQRAYGSGTSGDFVGDLASAAQAYEDGQVIVSTGKLNTGYIKMNANPNDDNTPYMDIVERTGSGLYDVALKVRLGDLSGLANSDYVFGNSNPGFGLATNNVFLQGGIIAKTGSIGGIEMDDGKLFTGAGNYNNSNTGFYVDSGSNFSLGSKLAWNPTTEALTIRGSFQFADGTDVATAVSNASNSSVARTVELSADKYVITFDSDGNETPSNQTITLTATPQNFTGDVYYEFYKDSTIQGSRSTTNTFSVDTTSEKPTATTPKSYEVKAFTDSSGGTAKSTDSLTLFGLQPGSDGTPGEPGTDSVQVILTNESHTISAQSDGTVTSFAGADTDVIVFEGITDKTSDYTISLTNGAGISTTLSVDNVAVTGMTNDSGSVTINAASGSVSINKLMSLTKARQGSVGSDGTSAKLLLGSLNSQVFAFDAIGDTTPTPLSIEFSFQQQNLSGSAGFLTIGSSDVVVTDAADDPITGFSFNNNDVSNGTGIVSGSITFASATNAGGVAGDKTKLPITITATKDGLSDSVTIFKVVGGTDGVSGTSGYGFSTTYDKLDKTGNTSMTASYALHTQYNENGGYTSDSTDITTDFSTVVGFQLHKTDAAHPANDNSNYLSNVVQVGDTVTFYISDNRWYTYSIVTIDSSNQTDRHNFKLSFISENISGGETAHPTAPGNEVEFRFSRAQDGTDGVNGTSAITALLTNDSHTLPVTSSIGVISYAGASTDIVVFQGTTDVTDDYTIARTSDSHITTTLSDDTITITESTTPFSGSVVITATSASVSLSKTMSISQALQGDDGEPGTNAKSLSVTADSQVFTFSSASNRTVPDDNTIEFFFSQQNLSGTIGSSDITVTDVFGGTINSTPSLGPSSLSGGSGVVSGSYVFATHLANDATKFPCTVTVSKDGLTDSFKVFALSGGADGDAGADAYTVFLTNESHTFPAANNGDVDSGELADGATEVRVFKGTTQLTNDNNSPYGANTYRASAAVSGITMSSTKTGNQRKFTPTAVANDSGTATITITDNTTSTVFTKTYTFSKSKEGAVGAEGSDSKTVALTAATNVITYDAAGANPSPSSTITLSANSQNFTDGYFKFTGDGITDEITFTNGTSANQTTKSFPVPSSYFSTPKTIRVGVADGNQTELAFDTVTIVAVQPGSDGDAGADAVTAFLTSEADVIPAASDGTVSSFAGSGTAMKVFEGITDKTSAYTYTLQNTTTGLTATLSTNVLSVSGLTPDSGSTSIKATSGSVTIFKTYSVAKSKAGATGADNQDFSYLDASLSGIGPISSPGLLMNSEVFGFHNGISGTDGSLSDFTSFLDDSGNFYLGGNSGGMSGSAATSGYFAWNNTDRSLLISGSNANIEVDKFFLGNTDTQFISGSNGNITISGDVNFEGKTSNGATVFFDDFAGSVNANNTFSTSNSPQVDGSGFGYHKYVYAGETAFVTGQGEFSGRTAQFGNLSGNDEVWLSSNKLIPFNENSLYELEVRYKIESGTSSPKVYAGITAYQSNGTTKVNASGTDSFGSQHYFAAAASTTTSDGTDWVIKKGYFKGTASSGNGGAHNSDTDPGTIHQDVLNGYIAPMFLANFDNQTGRTKLDYIKLTEIGGGGSSKISGDSITTGVIKSNNLTTNAGSEFRLDNGTFKLGGTLNPKLEWNGSTLAVDGTITANAGAIGGVNIGASKLYVGTGTVNNSNTGFYLDNSGNFSLKDKLYWNGSTLAITGNITLSNPNDFADPDANVTTEAVFEKFGGVSSPITSDNYYLGNLVQNLVTQTDGGTSFSGIKFEQNGNGKGWTAGFATKTTFSSSLEPIATIDVVLNEGITGNSGAAQYPPYHMFGFSDIDSDSDVTSANNYTHLQYGIYITRKDVGGSYYNTISVRENNGAGVGVSDYYTLNGISPNGTNGPWVSGQDTFIRFTIQLKKGGGAIYKAFRNGNFLVPIWSYVSTTHSPPHEFTGNQSFLSTAYHGESNSDRKELIVDQISIGAAPPAGTVISGDGITAGIIVSTNLNTDSGSKLDLDDGSMLMGGTGNPGFEVTKEGFVTATNLVEKSVIVTDANSGSYFETFSSESVNWTRLILDGSAGGDVTMNMVLESAPPYVISDLKFPANANIDTIAKLELQINTSSVQFNEGAVSSGFTSFIQLQYQSTGKALSGPSFN